VAGASVKSSHIGAQNGCKQVEQRDAHNEIQPDRDDAHPTGPPEEAVGIAAIHQLINTAAASVASESLAAPGRAR